jgi:hypothetical protein
MADHGCAVAGYDKDPVKVEALRKEAAKLNIRGPSDVLDFTAILRKLFEPLWNRRYVDYVRQGVPFYLRTGKRLARRASEATFEA